MILISIFLILLIVICAAIMGAMLQDDRPGGLSILLFIGALFMANLMITVELSDKGDKNSYKQGQIDALTNNIHYKLETQADSTKVWVEIK